MRRGGYPVASAEAATWGGGGGAPTLAHLAGSGMSPGKDPPQPTRRQGTVVGLRTGGGVSGWEEGEEWGGVLQRTTLVFFFFFVQVYFKPLF